MKEVMINGSWPKGPWFAVFAIPGALFLLYGILAIVRNSEYEGRVKV